ncbi:MAG: ABC transporter ATP-binding protein [Planctomycetota bacterium]|jgi:putative ABC transport system ATP-binding protein
MPNIVEIENLSKIYERGSVEIKPLDGIDLTVEEGEFLSLMGPSGSGKTTLLNIIAGIDSPTSGRVRVAGCELANLNDKQLSAWRLRSVGYVFQMYNLVPVLTAWENIELPLLLLPMSRQDRKRHVDAALAAAGLSDRADHYPRQLSGGQEQRVAIARAIVTDPRIIVADEPTGDLDAVGEEEILELLKALNQDFDKTFIMVTHDPNAAAIADRTLHLNKGVLLDGTLPGRVTETQRT